MQKEISMGSTLEESSLYGLTFLQTLLTEKWNKTRVGRGKWAVSSFKKQTQNITTTTKKEFW